jgi:hypothetical protein
MWKNFVVIMQGHVFIVILCSKQPKANEPVDYYSHPEQSGIAGKNIAEYSGTDFIPK